MNEKEVLQILRDSEALLSGHFELRSGLHSDQYFQCANVLRYPRRAEKLCAALVENLRAASPGGVKAEGVISPAMGGILVGHEIARALDLFSIFAEKQNNALVLHRFDIRKGDRYIVAEDVLTRGGRIQETIDLVTAAGGKVVAIAVLVDRSGGKAKFNYPVFQLLRMEPSVYEPAQCPLCRQGVPPTHPGSK